MGELLTPWAERSASEFTHRRLSTAAAPRPAHVAWRTLSAASAKATPPHCARSIRGCLAAPYLVSSVSRSSRNPKPFGAAGKSAPRTT